MGRTLFSLLTYIGYEPDWVRCTTWRDDAPQQPPALPRGCWESSRGQASHR
jgi:hypothetical protein